MVQTAQNLEWKILYYNDPTDNLIRSDVEELNGAQEPQTVESKLIFFFNFYTLTNDELQMDITKQL